METKRLNGATKVTTLNNERIPIFDANGKVYYMEKRDFCEAIAPVVGGLLPTATPEKNGFVDKKYAPLNIRNGDSNIRFVKIGTSPTPAIVDTSVSKLCLLVSGGNNYGDSLNRDYVYVINMSARGRITLDVFTILLGHPDFGYVINGNMVEWWIKLPTWSSPISFFPLLNVGFTLSLESRLDEPSGIVYFT